MLFELTSKHQTFCLWHGIIGCDLSSTAGIIYSMYKNILNKLVRLHKYLFSRSEFKFNKQTKLVRELLLSGKFQESNSLLLKISIDYINSIKPLDEKTKTHLKEIIKLKHISKEIDKSQINEVKTLISSEDLKEHQWLSLFNVFARNSVLILAYLFRENAKNESITLTNRIRSYIDSGDFFEAKNLVIENPNKVPISLLSSLQLIYNGQIKIPNSFKHFYNQKYHELIHDKNIAIVGPSPNDEKNGIEIDKYELVIRVNYTGKILGDHSNVGTKTDIIYYGNAFTEAIVAIGQDYNFIKELKMLVFKKRFKNNKFQELANNLNKFHIFSSPNPLFYNGSAMMIQNILFDILLHKPRSIKLFNTSFYLGEKTHVNEYHSIFIDMPNNDIKKFKGCAGFAHHDIVSNFNFVKNLFNHDLIEVDGTCKDILMNSSEEYISKLDFMYNSTI